MRYSPQLDGLRAIAILAVLAQHLFESHFRGAWVGVDIFFVLSGFLITNILISEHEATGTISLKNFYGRRALRLLPALVIAIAALGLITSLAGVLSIKSPFKNSTAYLHAATAALLYFSNFTSTDMSVLVHTWSLSVEEQFYLIWPLVLGGIVLALKPNKRIALLVALIFGFAALRFYLETQRYSWWNLYTWFFTRADELIAGALIACATSKWPEKIPAVARATRPLALGAIAFLVYVFCTADAKQRWLYQWGLTAIAISCAIIVFSTQFDSQGVLGRILKTKPFVWIGRRSYGMYVYHVPVIWVIAHYVNFPAGKVGVLLGLAAKAGVTMILSWASYRWIESPTLALKDTFFPTTTAKLQANNGQPVVK